MLGIAESSFGFGRRFSAITSITSLPNVQNYFTASSNNSIYFGGASISDGSTVTQWSDQSGGSHDANQSGQSSIKPTWESNIQNGLGALYFNGSQSLNINPISYLRSLSGASIFIVAKPTTLSGTNTLTITDANGYGIQYNGTNWQALMAGGTGVSTVTADTTKFRRFGIVFDGTLTGNANRLKFFYDGLQQSLTFSGTVGTATSGSAKYLYIGYDGSTNYFTGYIGMMAIWSRALTQSEILSADAYFKNYWGL